MEAPPPEKECLAHPVAAWTAYWADPISTVAKRTCGMPALKRLCGMRDKVYRYERAADGNELIEGSQGQLRLNPLLKQRDDLLVEIRQLEDRFGLTPKARL